jgi:hypothetical protein
MITKTIKEAIEVFGMTEEQYWQWYIDNAPYIYYSATDTK